MNPANGKITFRREDDLGHIEVVLDGTDWTLEQLFENFETFLKACGYSFEGQIDLVED